MVAVARVAVPIFFMLSGYFYPDTCSKQRATKKILQHLKIIIFLNLLYFFWQSGVNYISGTLGDFITKTFSLKMLMKMLFLNVSPFSGHLWYLNALLYVLVIIYYLDKNGKREILYFLTPFLLLCDLMFGKYSLLIMHRELPYILVRNFMFVGLPYFAIGCFIKVKKNFLEKYFNNIILKLFVTVFLVCNIFERILLIKYEVNAARNHYIFTTFLAFTLFLSALRYDKNSKIVKGLACIGRKYSGGIYVIHPIFVTVFSEAFGAVSIDALDYSAPIIVYLLSVCIIIGWDSLITLKNRLEG